MADLSVTATDVAVVKMIEQGVGPAAEAITAGQAVRLDTTSGKITKANASTAAEARIAGIALRSVAAGEAVTFVRKGIVSLGAAMDALTYDDDVFLSNTDGTLADGAGTVSTIVGTVVPQWTATTPQKNLRLDL